MCFDFKKLAKVYARKATCYSRLNPPEYDKAVDWYKKSL